MSDHIEEIVIGLPFPTLNDGPVRFIRAAGNTVLVYVGSEVVSTLNVASQERLAMWLARRVIEDM